MNIDMLAADLARELGDRAVNSHPRNPDDALWREAVGEQYIAETLTELTVTVMPHKPLVFACARCLFITGNFAEYTAHIAAPHPREVVPPVDGRPCARPGCEQPRVGKRGPYCLEHKREVGRESARRALDDPVRGPKLRAKKKAWLKENAEHWRTYMREYMRGRKVAK